MNRISVRKRHTIDSQRISPTPDDERSLITAYEELCNRHQQIDDFRGKLLALLPIASGAAALVLLRSNPNAVVEYLLPIGVYGMAITVGLFIYELHGIAVCKQIMDQASDLEEVFKIPEYSGQYRDRNQNFLHRGIEVEIASWIVYITVLGGWAYIAGIGGRWWQHKSPDLFRDPMFIVIVGAVIVTMKWLYAVCGEKSVHEKYLTRRKKHSQSVRPS